MSAHTAGPWVADLNVLQALNEGPLVIGAQHVVVAEVCTPDEQGRADAHLIAAAPDLLNALQRFAGAIGYEGDFEYVTGDVALYGVVRAAIAKARHESLNESGRQ